MAGIQTNPGSVIEVVLEGDVDIAMAAQLKKELAKTLDSGRDVRVSLAAVSRLDITGFQLLWAAARQATIMGRAFSFNEPLPAEILADLAQAGLPCRSFLEGES